MGIVFHRWGRNRRDLRRKCELTHAHHVGSNPHGASRHIGSHYVIPREGIHQYCHSHKGRLQYAFLQTPYRAIQDLFPHLV